MNRDKDKDIKKEGLERKVEKGSNERVDKTDEISSRETAHGESDKIDISETKEGKLKETEKEEIVTIKKEEYEKLKETAQFAEEFKDKYLRAHAELENTRKRFIKEREEYIKFANEEFLAEVLYVIDNFDRAMAHMNGTQKVESILEGIKMIQKQFHLFLEQNGVKKIESVGKKFDPVLHEAVEHVEVEPDKEGLIIEEIQSGYQLNGRLLRPAIVKVGKKKSN